MGKRSKSSEMKISIIVPLKGEASYACELEKFVKGNSQPQNVAEIIFISTVESMQLHKLGKEQKVRTLIFAGATSSDCLEAGAFEATGEILFFIKPGTFPAAHFDASILASMQRKARAGILRNGSPGGWWQQFSSMLPIGCVLCFVKADNLFTTRRMFHQKGKLLPRNEGRSFSRLIHQYALCFQAKVV